MSPPFNEPPLPAPPSAAISSATPGDEPHSKWDPIYIHTAKCDLCHQHNTSVIQRCPRCNRQLCKDCISHASLDGVHAVDMDALDWKVYTQPQGPKKRKTGNAGGKLKATASSSRAGNRSGIAKNTVSKKIKRAPSEGLFMDPGETSDGTEGNSATEHQRGKGRPENIQSLEEPCSPRTIHSTVPETPLDRSRKTTIRFRTPFKGSSSSPLTSSANASIVSLTRNRTTDNSSPFERSSDVPSLDRTEEDLEMKGETFDEVISRLKRERDARKLKEQEQAKEAGLRHEMIAAWESNPEVQALRQEGREDEANELMEAAATLIRAQRSL